MFGTSVRELLLDIRTGISGAPCSIPVQAISPLRLGIDTTLVALQSFKRLEYLEIWCGLVVPEPPEVPRESQARLIQELVSFLPSVQKLEALKHLNICFQPRKLLNDRRYSYRTDRIVFLFEIIGSSEFREALRKLSYLRRLKITIDENDPARCRLWWQKVIASRLQAHIRPVISVDIRVFAGQLFQYLDLIATHRAI